MSRSGLEEDDGEDSLAFGRWRGAVASAIRGKRGQAFLRELLAALDAMPEKKLIRDELQLPTGEVCALGCLGAARNVDMTKLDIYDFDRLGEVFDINPKLVQEVEWMNDLGGRVTPEQRFQQVRDWIVEQIVVTPPPPPRERKTEDER